MTRVFVRLFTVWFVTLEIYLIWIKGRAEMICHLVDREEIQVFFDNRLITNFLHKNAQTFPGSCVSLEMICCFYSDYCKVNWVSLGCGLFYWNLMDVTFDFKELWLWTLWFFFSVLNHFKDKIISYSIKLLLITQIMKTIVAYLGSLTWNNIFSFFHACKQSDAARAFIWFIVDLNVAEV